MVWMKRHDSLQKTAFRKLDDIRYHNKHLSFFFFRSLRNKTTKQNFPCMVTNLQHCNTSNLRQKIYLVVGTKLHSLCIQCETISYCKKKVHVCASIHAHAVSHNVSQDSQEVVNIMGMWNWISTADTDTWRGFILIHPYQNILLKLSI